MNTDAMTRPHAKHRFHALAQQLCAGALIALTLVGCATKGIYDPTIKGPTLSTEKPIEENETAQKQEEEKPHAWREDELVALKNADEDFDTIRLFRDENGNQIEDYIEGYHTNRDGDVYVRYLRNPVHMTDLGIQAVCQLDPVYTLVPLEKAHIVSKEKLEIWRTNVEPKIKAKKAMLGVQSSAQRAQERVLREKTNSQKVNKVTRDWFGFPASGKKLQTPRQ